MFDGIGIGASAFRFLAVSMVLAAAATIATLFVGGILFVYLISPWREIGAQIDTTVPISPGK